VSEVDPKQSDKATSSPDELVKASKDASIELADADLKNVSGGTPMQTVQDTTINKQKASDKLTAVTDAYIRS
jgi:hypothetical protein